jgi:hypothetical protein
MLSPTRIREQEDGPFGARGVDVDFDGPQDPARALINLGTNFGRGREETEDGRLLFVDHPVASRNCRCLSAWRTIAAAGPTWAVERHDGFLAMAARSKGEGVGTLHGMFTEAMPTDA